MKRPRLRARHAVAGGAVILLAAGFLLYGPRPGAPLRDEGGPLQGSSHHPGRNGAKALYTLLRGLGQPAFRHEQRLELVDEDTAVLLILAPMTRLSPDEVGWAVRWVEAGGTIIWSPHPSDGDAKAEPDGLPAAFGLQVRACEGPPSRRIAGALDGLGEDGSGVAKKSYSLAAPCDRRLAAAGTGAHPTVLARDDAGWLAAAVSSGDGWFIAVAEQRLWANDGLAAAENAEFMVHLVDRAVFNACEGWCVAFDEFHHGFEGGQTPSGVLWNSPLRYALGLGLVAALCGVLASGRRLGPPRDPHEEHRRRPGEFLDAFANLCRRHRAGPQALGMIIAEFRADAQSRTGAAGPEALERAGARAGLPPGRAAEILRRAEDLAAAPSATDADLLDACRTLESFRSALRRPGPLRSPQS